MMPLSVATQRRHSASPLSVATQRRHSASPLSVATQRRWSVSLVSLAGFSRAEPSQLATPDAAVLFRRHAHARIDGRGIVRFNIEPVTTGFFYQWSALLKSRVHISTVAPVAARCLNSGLPMEPIPSRMMNVSVLSVMFMPFEVRLRLSDGIRPGQTATHEGDQPAPTPGER